MAVAFIEEDADTMLGDIPPISLVDGKLTESQAAQLSQAVRNLISKVNGGLSHGSGATYHKGNFDEHFVEVLTPSVADTEFPVVVNLGRAVRGVEIALANASANVYTSREGSWTEDLIFLKCTAAGATLRLRVY